MKNIKLKNISFKAILGICMVTFMTISCEDDFLDREPITSLTSDAIQTEDDIASLVIATYDPLRWQVINNNLGHHFPVMFQGIRADDVFSQWANFWVAGRVFDQNPVPPNNPSVLGWWRKWFTMISRANTAIGVIEESPDEIYADPVATKAQLIAEARFLRGLAYLELVKNFGGVPVITERITDANFDFKIPRSTAQEVYDNVIEPDLLAAAQALPATAAQQGRATSGAAYAFLAKAHLYQEEYAQTVEYTEEVMALGYSLEENFGDNFSLTNEYGKESIFEIGYEANIIYNNWESPGGIFNQGSATHQLMGFLFNSGVGNSAFGNAVPRQELIDFYDDSDQRKNATFITPLTVDLPTDLNGGVRGPISCGCQIDQSDQCLLPDQSNSGDWLFGTDTYGFFWQVCDNAGNVLPSWISKATMRKYHIPVSVQENTLNFADSPLNEKMMRYAEVLLMHAEASILGGGGDGASSFQQVLDRAYGAGNPAAPTYTFQGIKDERRRELATEGWNRYTDLVRWGDAETVLNNVEVGTQFQKVFVVGRDELLPIPQSEIDQVGSDILQQNPGYN
ncbi:RagB/SusD family nutrient uptake outer membrane protein [Aquimarina spongiae]|uniref:Starch-binding associating with outer membrane n=1 Tax=Aquimarina spongiae TaxID=570521 RepID=A0A1M6HAU8_9FLAO|nr:RagB/SusD family nutrient uptake outer membrane protein [Aquimarina spongiae]SHJ19325.1 Starch-binding associating with outer membrane [Aquimarina spongiae]